MSLHTTILNFDVLPTSNCGAMAIVDERSYASDAEGMTLQIQLPDRENIIETVYQTRGVTVLNSNSLKYTKVREANQLQDLPDGWYTIKMSICPYDQFWVEKDYYRVCKLQCKWYQALLKLDLNKCDNCYANAYSEKLRQAWFYLQGITANAENNDLQACQDLYKVTNNILDNLLYCTDCGKKGSNPSHFSNSSHRNHRW